VTASLALIIAASAMIGCGIYLVMERSLTRVLVGLVMLGNGVNVLFLISGGPPGRAPIVDPDDPSRMSDPLPQALVLTAIVISLATAAFVLAMAYRSWQLTGHDDVQDDVEDRAIRRLAETDAASDSYDLSSGGGESDLEMPEEEGTPV
jgi:multicomponent Na+:H+ antiporter subunit C